MTFEQPAPDLQKLITAWESWENGQEQPGKTLSALKTAGLAVILRDLIARGWQQDTK